MTCYSAEKHIFYQEFQYEQEYFIAMNFQTYFHILFHLKSCLVQDDSYNT